MPRPVHLSELPLMLRSFLSSVSRGLVYVDIPGRTYLHELFIGCTSRRHYSLVNFEQPVGRSHWASCWHGSYGIIYNPLQSPQPSIDSHRAINANDIQVMPVYITVKNGESQANSLSHLETRGLRWHDSANLASFSKVKNPGRWRER